MEKPAGEQMPRRATPSLPEEGAAPRAAQRNRRRVSNNRAMAVPHRAFLRNLEALEEAIIDPGGIATKLYSKGLIDNLARQRAQLQSATTLERSRELLQKLEAKIEKEDSTFDEFLSVLDEDPTMEELCRNLRATVAADEALPGNTVHSPNYACMYHTNMCRFNFTIGLASLIIGAISVILAAVLWVNIDCYQLGTCYSRSLPYVDNFVGREEDIRNITEYLDFDHSNIQVVHIVGPPGFGKSTLAKQIGHILLRKSVKVHYVDIRAVTDMDAFAERVLFNVIESTNRKITLKSLRRWVKQQYSKTLLIIDNCDEMFETHRDDFIESINEMISSQKSIKYLLTSQKWVADVGVYQLHDIYNLSSEAAGELLGIVAPGLTEDQKIQIAELTGNVPLALDVVGAIFKFPNAPSAEEVINGLKDNPVFTLSPSELHSKVDASIGLAYSYLPSELKELCVNLSHFPGSFDRDSAVSIFDLNIDIHKESPLDLLVQRSLLQFNRPTKRYHFHQLIRSYFLQIQGQFEMLYFMDKFQFHFANVLDGIMDENYSALAMLDLEKQNFQYMFSLFMTANHTNHTFYAVEVTLTAIDSVLKQRFHPMELCDISHSMLKAMDSYTTDKIASHESFLETYAKVVTKVAELEKQSHFEIDSAIQILSSRKKKIDDGFKRQEISRTTFMHFFKDLAEYYRDKGEDRKSAQCHEHILEIVHDQRCSHNCNYFGISIAYWRIGDRGQAFHFRELAYENELSSLSRNRMLQAHLFLALYNDYLNVSLGNNISKAAIFSSMIIETVYDYLINASEAEYIKNVYFNAIDFFREKYMEDHMVALQEKMQAMEEVKCPLLIHNCSHHHYKSAVDAWERNYLHFAIHSGKRSLKVIVDPVSRVEIYSIVGASYFLIGNYTDSQNWLKIALKHYHNLSTDLRYDYSLLIDKGLRIIPCVFLILSGDYYNLFCYGYFIKDFMSAISTGIIKTVRAEYSARSSPRQPPPKPKTVLETGVTEVKYSFIWSQFEKKVRKYQAIFEKYISFLKQTMDQVLEAMGKSKILFVLHLVSLLLLLFSLPYILSFLGIIYIIADVMSCCTERQIRCCFSCATFCIFLGIFSTIAMFVFVLGLDVLY